MNIPICLSLISTKYASVIAIASRHRFKCRSRTGWSSVRSAVGKCKILSFMTEKYILTVVNVYVDLLVFTRIAGTS